MTGTGVTGASARVAAPFSTAEISDAVLAEIEAELGPDGDGVWIAPAFAAAHDLSAADEQRIEEVVARSTDSNLRVVLVELDRNDPRFQGGFDNLAAWIHDDLSGDATYLGWEAYDRDLTLATFGEQPDDLFVDSMVRLEHPGDVVAQVERAEELLADGNAYELWSALDDDEKYGRGPDTPGADGGGGAWAYVVLAVVLAAGLYAGARLLRGAGRRHARGREKFVLPPTVLRTVRAAEDRALRRDADAETMALGQRLVAEDLTSLDAGGLQVWQQAMDHHEAARRVLEVGSSPADVVGALVLARRGEEARAAAVAGDREWEPTAGCWFNPLHAGPCARVTWRDGTGAAAREVEVPACRACAEAVRRGDEPDDVLDFVEGDRVVHYYRLDIGPWSATGYGTLEPDLLGALRKAGRPRRPARLPWR